MSATPDINVRHNNITNNITNNNNINNKEEKENYIKEKESWSLADSVDYFFKTIPVEKTEYLGRAVERIGSERIKNGASAWDLRRAVDGFNNADVADTRWYKAKKLFTPNHIWGFAESGRDNMRHWIDKLEVYELRMARYNALPTFGGSKADGC